MIISLRAHIVAGFILPITLIVARSMLIRALIVMGAAPLIG
jgi:hypothetical protein